MRDYQIRKIWIDRRARDNPFVNRILSIEADAEVKIAFFGKEHLIENISFREGKQSLFLTEFPGSFVKRCPGTGRGYLCCGYSIVNQPIGCPLDCTYCILQDYLGPSPLILYVNFDQLKEELDRFIKKHKGSFLRIGNGELADSLALDYLGALSSFFISYFRDKKNVVFEFKTKTDEIDKILQLPSCKNIVISWSLNPESVVCKEERFTASLRRRLDAAYKVQEKGFMLGFHFDPIILYQGWEKDYEKLIGDLFQLISPSQILWISLGALRFPPSLKGIIQQRFPESRIIYEEMVRGLDGKLRYIKPLRVRMFKRIYSLIKERAPDVFCYLCMESPDVWEKVMGFSPRSNLHFKKIFDEHCRRVLGD